MGRTFRSSHDMSHLFQPYPFINPPAYSPRGRSATPSWCDDIPGLANYLLEYGSYPQFPHHSHPQEAGEHTFNPTTYNQPPYVATPPQTFPMMESHQYSPEASSVNMANSSRPPLPPHCEFHGSPHSPLSSPDYEEEETCNAPPTCSATPLAPQFGKRVDEFFTEAGVKIFFCDVCQEEAKLNFDGNKIIVSCGHYQCCNECRSRLVRQLLRCSHCCEAMVDEFPVCDVVDQCQIIAQKLGQGLSTTGCPRCGQKLSKETCGTECNRTSSREYKRARRKLLKSTATMVLRPEFCERQPQLGERPCSHFTKCKTHGFITQGRANQPRCPACKGESRRGTERGPGRKINLKTTSHHN